MGFAPCDWVRNVMGMSTMKCDYTSKERGRERRESLGKSGNERKMQVEQVGILIHLI